MQRQRGFTMVELVVVLLVIAVLASLAMMRSTSRESLHERSFADQLRSQIRHARSVAIAQQRDTCVLIGPARSRSVYAAGPICDPARPVAAPGGSGAFDTTTPPGVALGGAAQVRFNGRGQPQPNVDTVVQVGVLVLTVSRETGIVP